MGCRFFSTLLLCLVVTDAPGEELFLDWLEEIPPPPQSSFGISFGTDDADGWSRQADLSLAGPSYVRVDFSYGESYVESDDARLETRFRSLSLSTDPLVRVSGAFGYEDWGDEDALTIETIWLELALNLGDFSIALRPQQRDIQLEVLEWVRRFRSHVDLESRDLGLRLDYYGLDGWVLSGSYFYYDYTEDLSRLDEDRRAQFIFPLNTLDLATGLDERSYSLGLGTQVGGASIDLDWTRSRSAVDGSHSTVTSLSGDFSLDDHFGLSLMGGAQDVDYAEELILFANIGLNIIW
jgi:hypothetical protein